MRWHQVLVLSLVLGFGCAFIGVLFLQGDPVNATYMSLFMFFVALELCWTIVINNTLDEPVSGALSDTYEP